MTGIRAWVSGQLAVLGTPSSDIEYAATCDFFKTGLERNRFLALIKAVSTIATSGIMCIGNPVTGTIRGAALLCQLRITEGFYTIGAGARDMIRSAYNVIRVFTVAVLGLLPGFNPVLYTYGPPPPKSVPNPLQEALNQASTQIEALNREIGQLKKPQNRTQVASAQDVQALQADHEQEIQNLTQRIGQLQDKLSNPGKGQLKARGGAQDPREVASAKDVPSVQNPIQEIESLKAFLTNIGTSFNIRSDLAAIALNPSEQGTILAMMADTANKLRLNNAKINEQKETIARLRGERTQAQQKLKNARNTPGSSITDTK